MSVAFKRITITEASVGVNVVTGAYDPQDWYGVVTFDGRTLSPKRSQKVWNHSPDGFSWGYYGSGPAQLALAILLEAGVSVDDARKLHQEFKQQFVAKLPERDSFMLRVNVKQWAEQKLKEYA